MFFFAFPRIIRQFNEIRNEILARRPTAVILVDYPDFNLRLARSLRRKGYKGKIIHYISPSVWAWRRGRIKLMEKHLDLLLTIYPFEKDYFSNTNLHVEYVGNPLQEVIHAYQYRDDWITEVGIPDTNGLISVFPGSRPSEIINNLPTQLKAMQMFRENHPNSRFGISCANNSLKTTIEKQLHHQGFTPGKETYLVPADYRYELMRDSHTALAKSGTVTLELALHKRPTVVSYTTTAFNRFILQYFINPGLTNYCIVNIIANKRLFPEFIEDVVTADKIYHALKTIHNDHKKREEMIEGCEEISKRLDGEHASEKAAKAIKELLS